MILSESPRRLGIYFFYDRQGVVDRYVETLLTDLNRHLERLVIVVNGTLTETGLSRLSAISGTVIERENAGLDVWAYKTAMEHVGWDELATYDELVLANSTIMGPVFPFSEMFDAMAARDLDFWGPTCFHQVDIDPFGYSPYGYIPVHLQSHFHVYRRSLVTSQEFQRYWDEMPMIHSYEESVGLHEVSFTKHFADLGFRWGAYADSQDMEGLTYQPILFEPVRMLAEKRCPIFKRRTFFHDYADVLDQSIGNAAADLYAYLRDETDYDTDLLWENLLRTVDLSALVRNLKLTYVLPTSSVPVEPNDDLRVALCIHAHYMDLLPELLRYADSMPARADIVVSVSSQDKAEQARAMAASLSQDVTVRIVRNRGRDVAALLVGLVEDVRGYDLVCFIHDKKVTQSNPGTVGEGFALKGYENVLGTPELVRNVIARFESEPRLGVLMPPPPNHAEYFPIYANTWGPNYARTLRLLGDGGVHVPIDRNSEVIAPLGSIFWFRPAAVRSLLDMGWEWEDFPPEPLAVDGTISHAIERSYCYVAQGAGYYSAWLLSDRFAAIELTNLSFCTRQLTRAVATRWGGSRLTDMLRRITVPLSARQVIKDAVGRRVPMVARPVARLVLRSYRTVRKVVR